MARWYVTHSIKLLVEADDQQEAEDKSFNVLVEQSHCPISNPTGELIDWRLDTKIEKEE